MSDVNSRQSGIPKIWYRWLQVAIVGLILFGLAMIVMPDLFRQFFSLLVYASPTAISSQFGVAANDYILLAHGVLGAVLFGWGVMMLLALQGSFLRQDPEGWSLIAIPLLAWYIPDTAFSLYTGFWQNAVLNTGFAVMFAIPLAATHHYFPQPQAQQNKDHGIPESYR